MNNVDVLYVADTRAKRPMVQSAAYTGIGWQVYSFAGGKDDYADFKMDETLADGERSWVPLMVSGVWEGRSLETGQSWTLTVENPQGLVDGRVPYAEHRGRSRAYCGVDGTRRLCAYPVNAFRQRSFESIDHDKVLGVQRIMRVRRGGIFCLASGHMVVGGKAVAGPHIIEARSSDVVLSVPANCYGASIWRR